MPSRVEKYSNINEHKTRTDKFKNIYENTGVMELNQIIDIEPIIERKNFSIDSLNEINKRKSEDVQENNQKIEYQNDKEEVEKDYDINVIIEKAKENRTNDTNEKYKKLKKDEYNITNTILSTKENITGINEKDGEELSELINTIYSNNLKEEIQKAHENIENDNDNLLNELIGGDDDDKIESANNLESTKVQIKVGDETSINLDVNQAINAVEEENKKQENTFFTKSMEFADDDLIDDDFYIENKKKKYLLPIILVIFIFIIIGLACYVYFFR